MVDTSALHRVTGFTTLSLETYSPTYSPFYKVQKVFAKYKIFAPYRIEAEKSFPGRLPPEQKARLSTAKDFQA
jgi:hypothetical protein